MASFKPLPKPNTKPRKVSLKPSEFVPPRTKESVQNHGGHSLVLSPSDPTRSAGYFISEFYTQDSSQTLHHHRGRFYVYTGTHYREAEDQEIKSYLYEFLEAAKQTKDKKCVPFEPDQRKVSNVLDALKAKTHLSSAIDLPVWLSDWDEPAHEVLACQNCLLHLPSGSIIDHTPTFFGYESLPFRYDPDAPPPVEWHKFLGQLWWDDPASIDTLQEWFGYCLTPDTRQQKILLMVGPKRAGKGTIGRIQRELLGRNNVCGPTLSSLTTNFGLQPLIGKRLAIVSDARLSKRVDQSIVAERLLSISGEDAMTIDRKYGKAWSGTLPTRFMIQTNELPRIWDASGALASHFIVLVLTKSFYGQEDTQLSNRLATELPGILNWGIDGWVRLQRRGHFVQPKSSEEMIRELEYLGSPILEFIRDRCMTGPQFSISIDELFDAWKQWCQSQGSDHHGTKATFGRNLHAALPSIRKRRLHIDGELKGCYEGLKLLARQVSLKPKDFVD